MTPRVRSAGRRHSLSRTLVLGAALVLAGAAGLPADQRPSYRQFQEIAGGRDDDAFAQSMAVSGETAVVSADDAGIVIVYDQHPIDDAWFRAAELTVEDAAAINFGVRVAIDGDTVVVAADRDGEPNQAGAAYVFERDEGGLDAWGQTAKLVASDPAEEDRLGSTAVAIFADTVAVGTQWRDGPGGDLAGAVYVFERDPGDPGSWSQTALLTASDGVAGERFGWAIDMDDDEIVIAAVADDDFGVESGSVYVFRRDPLDPSAWVEVAKLTAADASEDDAFGHSVAIDGDLIAVGANEYLFGHRNGSGMAYVFERDAADPTRWSQLSKVTPPDLEYGDAFGVSVDLRNDLLLVGADQRVYFPGAAYVFRRSTLRPDVWRRIVRLLPADVDFSYTADFGDTVALGADGAIWVADWLQPPYGFVYVFRPIVVDPAASVSGSCPGFVTVTTTGLTPDNRVRVYAAGQPGDAVLSGGPCIGRRTGLAEPLFLAGEKYVPFSGTDRTYLTLKDGDCGFFVQTVDLASCAVSNVVRLPLASGATAGGEPGR